MNILTFDIEEWYIEKKYHGDRKERYQEFDYYLNSILDLMERRNIKATFFCLGKLATDFPHVVKTIAGTPHFNVNIKAFAQNSDYANMLLDAAASEALSEGSYDVVVETGMFNANEIINKNLRLLCNTKAPKELRFWPTLFFLKE